MTRPWLSVSREADVTEESATGEAVAIGTLSGYTVFGCASAEEVTKTHPESDRARNRESSRSSFGIHVDFLSAVKGGFFLRKKPLECVLSVFTNSETALVDARRARAQHNSSRAAYQNDANGDSKIVGHGMRPARGIGQVLADPEQQNGGDHRELAGNDQQGMPEVAPFVEGLHLVWGEVALFRGKKEVCHRVTFSWQHPGKLGGLPLTVSIQSHRERMSLAGRINSLPAAEIRDEPRPGGVAIRVGRRR